MKKIFLLLFISSILTQKGLAQEQEDVTVDTDTTEQISTQTEKTKSLSNWLIGLSLFQWNETLKLQQGILSDKDVANFNAIAFSIQKEVTYYRWGWNMAAFIGSGRAVGGGTSTNISYQKDKVAFTIFGVSPRIFYRLSGRINAGLTGMAFLKNMDWPLDATNQTIDSGRKTNLIPLADLNIRLFRNWDFYSGLGPLADEGTLWKVGLNYRF